MAKFTERLPIKLPAKDTQPIGSNGLRETPESAKRTADKQARREASRKESPATAKQREVLMRHGEWEDGLTKLEASKRLSRLGI